MKKIRNLLYPYLNKEKNKFENENKMNILEDAPLIYETKSEKNYNLLTATRNTRKNFLLEMEFLTHF